MAEDRVLGIDIGARSIKVSQVNHTGNGPVVEKYVSVPIPFGSISDGVISVSKRPLIVEALQKVASSGTFDTKDVVVGLNNPNSTFFHQVSVPMMSENDIRSSKENLLLAADTGLDIGYQQVEFSVLGHAKRGNRLDVMFYLVHDEVAESMCRLVEEAGFEIVGVDLTVLAALRGANIDMNRDTAQAVLMIGADAQSLLVHSGGVPLFLFGDSSLAGNEMSRLIADVMSLDPDDEEVEATKMSTSRFEPNIESVVQDYSVSVSDRVLSTFGSYRRTNPDAPPISSILLIGGGTMLSGLARTIQSRTNMKTLYASPAPNFGGDLSRAVLHLTSIGLTTGARE